MNRAVEIVVVIAGVVAAGANFILGEFSIGVLFVIYTCLWLRVGWLERRHPC